MAEHDWRELLDDPEIEGIVRRVYLGPGRRYYQSTRNALALDDLESWLWDQAVRIATAYPGAPSTAYDPAGHFHAHLYRNLAKSITEGWHYSVFAGPRDTDRRAATTTMTSLDLQLESGAHRIEANATLATNRRLTSNDPLAIVLHLERLQDLIQRADRQGAHGPFIAETSPYCSENLCLQPTYSRGLCRAHHDRERRAWGETCSVEGCTKGVTSRGLCPTHYSAYRSTRPDAPTCTHDGCTKPADIRGMCRTHYGQARRANAETWAAERADKPTACTHPGCDLPVRAKGLCSTHYGAARYKEREHQR